VAMEDVYGRRLDLVRPGAADLDWLGEFYVATMVEGARELVTALAADGREIHVVSGGVRRPVARLARELGLGDDRVHAVAVRLDAHGRYDGWDQGAPTARSGGKAEVVGRIAAGRPAVMVGDGVTDLEARAAGARVIGFGGVAVRPKVRDGADAWVAGPSLLPVLDVIRGWDAQG
jgi:phosphoserine phosphatase